MINTQPLAGPGQRLNVWLRLFLTGLRGCVVASSFGAVFLAGYLSAILLAFAAGHDVADVDYQVELESVH